MACLDLIMPSQSSKPESLSRFLRIDISEARFSTGWAQKDTHPVPEATRTTLQEFQMALSPSLVFDFPTVRALEDHLVEESKG